ncbi:hypothetical protein CCHL11_05861 [Colletotrichum chlorophyti]|uniref:GPI anchored serine-threonine rich protein n=1 Tax=Colletotrichum chlorophyti TaxID=708187 RepID=A0A1Q8RN15_9PEZI|nr:hypothetical protein CCHL11_05861 [Colletotrichum chlorophyti]
MKFFLPVALLVAAVAAQDEVKCDAAPIVEACLTSENAKVSACGVSDYDCLCAAHQAVATCYNNCPNDSRASSAQGQVTIFCQQASIYGSAALRKASETAAAATASGTGNALASNSASATPTRTAVNDAAATTSASTPTSTPNMGVAQLARNTGGVLLAVAGVVAAVL